MALIARARRVGFAEFRSVNRRAVAEEWLIKR